MSKEQGRKYDEIAARVVTGGEDPLPALFAFVQAMPYRFPGPRDARHTLERGWGTCAGKNYLLAELLQAVGVRVAHLLAVGDLRDMLPDLPPDLRALAKSGPLPDVHSFLTARGPDGPVLVDASWDPPLAAYGFPVQPLPWDGRSDTVPAIHPHAVYAVTGSDPSAEKEEVRARLYRDRPADKARRDRYLLELSAWMEVIRASFILHSSAPPPRSDRGERR
jgi:arylamine N-acetyltransferase